MHYDRHGDPDVLHGQNRAAPAPGPGDVLIDVVAAGVNYADVRQRAGFYPLKPGANDVLGLECSGRIAAVGADVADWSVGQEVCALLPGGGYAEQAVVDAGLVLPVPRGVDLTAAAALPEAAATVWSNLFGLARLQPGETLLVHGGGGGVGSMAVQVAAAAGAHVVATASAGKLDRCREFGAELAVDYRTEDFVKAVLDHTGGRGADVVLDNMGGSYLQRNVDATGLDGRIVVIGLQGGKAADVDLGTMMSRRQSLLVTSLRDRPLADRAEIIAGVRELIWPLVEQGTVGPVVDRVLPLGRAAEAHRVVEASEHVGKVLLSCRS